MDAALKRFVRRALMDLHGIEIDIDEITEVSTSANPITGKPDVHATIVLKAPPQKIVITAKELTREQLPE